MESTYIAYFTEREQKVEKITGCILLLDTLKFLLLVAWEGKILAHKQYEEISLKLDEIGKMLGGWKKSVGMEKKNRTI